jgi:hypothetical protein
MPRWLGDEGDRPAGWTLGERHQNHRVLTEDEALELLAYLVTSARTQVDEAGSMGRCGC